MVSRSRPSKSMLTRDRVLYLGDTALRPHALYTMLADLLGLRPTPRARLLAELRRALVRTAIPG